MPDPYRYYINFTVIQSRQTPCQDTDTKLLITDFDEFVNICVVNLDIFSCLKLTITVIR